MKKRELIYISVIILVSIVLFITNYKPGTYLVGWDNVMPELNLKANLWRNLHAVWQGYRGLGVEDGMAHAANTVHTLFIWILSLILPQNVLRYFFHIFVHMLGGIGIYLLMRKMRKTEELSLAAGLLYMFNFAVVQMFFAPLEVFSIHFSSIPWLVLTATNLLEHRSKKNISLFFLASILATPQGFVPTVFIAYLIVIFSLILNEILINGKKRIKEILIILAIVLTTNSFWLFPFIHGAATQGNIIKNAKINQISSDEIFEKNRKRGNLVDVLYMKGFMVDIAENDLDERLVNIMKPWNDYTNQPIVFFLKTIGVVLVIVGLLSIIFQAIKVKKMGESGYLTMVFAVSLTMLAVTTPPMSVVNDFLRNAVPLFGEAFRFPFTKFFTVYAFAYSILLILGFEYLLNKYLHIERLKRIMTLSLTLIILLTALPAFSGNFFYKAEKIKIPSQYSEVIEYFKNENKNGRVMTLPQPTFWNWPFYKWGYRGSGFLWYGIEQPMMERPFDPWSNYNEQYFNELFYALQLGDQQLFMNVVEKYDIQFILIDDAVSTSNKTQQYEKLVFMVEQIFPNAEKTTFAGITVFRLNRSVSPIEMKKVVTPIGSRFNNEFLDQAKVDFGPYYYSEDNWNSSYLFPSLFSNKTQLDLEYYVYKTPEYLTIEPKNKITGFNDGNYILNTGSILKSEFYVPALAQVKDSELIVSPPEAWITIDGEKYQVEFFKPLTLETGSNLRSVQINDQIINPIEINRILLYSTLDNDLTFINASGVINTAKMEIEPPVDVIIDLPSETLINGDISFNMEYFEMPSEYDDLEVTNPCPEDIRTGLSVSNEENGIITLSSKFSAGCANLFLDKIPQQTGIIISAATTNLSGMPLKLLIDNPNQKSTVIDTKLNGVNPEKNIIIPPTTSYIYSGYGLHFRNESSGLSESVNTIENIEVGYLPYRWLKTIRLESAQQIEDPTLFYLSESYSKGWVAFLDGKKLEHVLVNNWANGWIIPQDSNPLSKPFIIFWPQLLEYAGFILLGGLALRILSIKK